MNKVAELLDFIKEKLKEVGENDSKSPVRN
jgi:hypothetical protein